MAKTIAPLSDTACRTSKPREREYKLFDGNGLYLLVQPNSRKGWRLRYVKPDGLEGLTSLGSYPRGGAGRCSAQALRAQTATRQRHRPDPIQSKQQAKVQAVVNGRTFESVALDWYAGMVPKWAPGHAKTVLSRLKTHVFPAIVDLDTHDLMQPLEALTKRGTIDVALRVKNYLQSIMSEAKRLRLIGRMFDRSLMRCAAAGSFGRQRLFSWRGLRACVCVKPSWLTHHG